MHDVFKIDIDQFWSVGPLAGCRSVPRGGLVNHFNGSDTSNLSKLNCVIVGDPGAQTAWIYGLGTFIDLKIGDEAYRLGDLRINDITNPKGKFPSDSFSWKLQTIRFQTRIVLEEGVFSNGPNVEVAKITAVEYKPSWGLPVTDILPGMTLFMDISFTTINTLTVDGEAIVEVNEKIKGNTWGNSGVECFLENNFSDATHTAQ
jgi:hypothetical protein